MKFRAPLLLFGLVSASFAQGTIPVRPVLPTGLREYLQLTNDQVVSIVRLNAEYLVFSVQKQVRMGQVRREIVEWTNASPIDPMQLGLRYAEIEAIRRELEDEQKRTQQKVFAVLNDAQKARVKVLEEALKLEPRINEAICANILVEPPSQLQFTIPGLDADISALLPTTARRCVQAIINPVLQP